MQFRLGQEHHVRRRLVGQPGFRWVNCQPDLTRRGVGGIGQRQWNAIIATRRVIRTPPDPTAARVCLDGDAGCRAIIILGVACTKPQGQGRSQAQQKEGHPQDPPPSAALVEIFQTGGNQQEDAGKQRRKMAAQQADMRYHTRRQQEDGGSAQCNCKLPAKYGAEFFGGQPSNPRKERRQSQAPGSRGARETAKTPSNRRHEYQCAPDQVPPVPPVHRGCR